MPLNKHCRLDVRVKADHGCLFDIEAQVSKDYMNERGLFYGTRMGSDAMKPGMAYDEMPSILVINLVDFYIRDKKSKPVEPVFVEYDNNPRTTATDKFKMYHVQLLPLEENSKSARRRRVSMDLRQSEATPCLNGCIY